MIKVFNKLNNITKFFICIILVFIILILIKKVYSPEPIIQTTKIEKTNKLELKIQTIKDETDKYNIDVTYPKYNNDSINNEIMDFIYKFINDFKSKETETKNNLIITYEITNKDNYSFILFNINDSTNELYTMKTIIINTDTEKMVSINEVYDETELKEKINTLISKKYSHYISDIAANTDLNEFNYKIIDEVLYVYFNRNLFEFNISYIPYIVLDDTSEIKDRIIDPTKPMIAFTFDDGPSDYTESVVENLYLNGGRATFFMLGNKMKYKSDTLLNVLKYNMEIGSHTYAHKRLTKLKENEILSEINTTNSIYKEITGLDIKYIRAPYGSLNSKVKELTNYPIILWNMDTEDWLSKNPDKVYDYTMNNLKDGNILLMHDVYPTTLEAVKMVVPEVIAKGYQIVTVSELAKAKEKTLEPHTSYRYIK